MTEALCADATCLAVSFTNTNKLHERDFAPYRVAAVVAACVTVWLAATQWRASLAAG
jgi:hypothetical protein